MSDLCEGSFSLLVVAKESKFEGRAQKEGINPKIQLLYLYAPQTFFTLRGVTVL